MSHGGRPSLDRGDTVRCICNDCGERFTFTQGIEDDPARSYSLCPDCYPIYQRVRDALVAGTWTIRDDLRRAMFRDLIESNTEYSVYEQERVGDLYVYDPTEVDDV